jgi:choline dehydrogenase-like flavoprotein
MQTLETDVLIVGSGFGAAAPAKRLAEAGFRVTVIEKGPRLDPGRDFRQTQDPKYLLKYIKGIAGERLHLTYAEALGGGSGFYEMVSLRAPSQAFQQVDQSGHRLWPAAVDRRALDPYYDAADAMLRVEQIAQDEIPRTGLLFALMMKRLGLSCERARYAVRGCVGSGFCVTGCIYGAKQTLLQNYLPDAVAAGAAIETELDVRLISPMGNVHASPRGGSIHQLPHRYEVVCRRGGEDSGLVRYRAKIVILAGGTVGTAKLLLNSRAKLPELSHQVGRNIAFNGGVKVVGLLSAALPDGDMFTGRTHPGMISYQFLAARGITISAAKVMPVQAVAAARLRLEGDPREPWYWGEPNVEVMRKFRRRMIALVSFGMTPPLGRLTARPDGGFDLECGESDDLRTYHEETRALLESILRRNGCRIVEPSFLNGEGAPHPGLYFSTAHQVGSCRMAEDKSRGVVDAGGEVFDYPGLYVTDGSAIPSSLAVNTSLTILANAERIAAGLLSRYSTTRPALVADRQRRW